MQKIIYIAGLGHSGSTILDMLLATQAQVTGLGEVYTLLDDKTRDAHYTSTCSCGKLATECSFWKNVPTVLAQGESISERYDRLIEYFREKYGPNQILVDSSKNAYVHLAYLKENYELKVLFLTRDFRSWMYSRSLSTKKPMLYFGLRWWLENWKNTYRLKKMGIEYFRIGYEELALYPAFVLPKIANYIDIPTESFSIDLSQTNSHIISGNIARADAEKKRQIVYDARWLLSTWLSFVSPLLFFCHRWNKRYVYSNLIEGSIDTFHLFGTKRRKAMAKKFN